MSLAVSSDVTKVAPPEQSSGPSKAAVRLVLILVVSMIAPQLDGTITNVALKTLAGTFNSPLSSVQWVSTAYMLATAVMIPITGWAAKRLGDKNLWLTACALFLVGSIGAALAWNLTSLIVWRVVQAAGGAIEATLMMVMVMKAAGGKNIASLAATLSLPALIVPICGPLVGGAILTHLTWHWIFWINVPISLTGLVLAARFLPKDDGGRKHPFDAIGLSLAGVGTAALLYGISQAGSSGSFGAPQVIIPGLGGLLLLTGFVVWTRHIINPAVDLKVFAVRSFSIATLALTFASFALYGATLLLPLFWQTLRGATALAAGAALIPQALGSLVTRTTAGKMTDRFGARWVVFIGAIITTAATVPFIFMGANTSWIILAIVLFIRGLGLSGIVMPTIAASYFDMPKGQLDSASIVSRVMQSVGNAFGAAVAAVLLEWGMGAGGMSATGAFHMAFIVVTALTLVVAGLALNLGTPKHQ